MPDTLCRFLDGLAASLRGGGVDLLFTPLLVLVVFGAGGFAGLLTIAHAVRRALETARSATFAFLVSLSVGAHRAPVLEVSMRLAEAGKSWATALPRFGLAALLGAPGIITTIGILLSGNTAMHGPNRHPTDVPVRQPRAHTSVSSALSGECNRRQEVADRISTHPERRQY